MSILRWAAAALLLLGSGCSEPRAVLDPAEGSMAGYYRVQIELPEGALTADEIDEVRFGDVWAYDLQVEGELVLSVMVQGHPQPGPVDVKVVRNEDATGWVFDEAFTFLESADPVFDRMVALGASFSQGVQGAVPIDRGVLRSPPAVIAQQAGAEP